MEFRNGLGWKTPPVPSQHLPQFQVVPSSIQPSPGHSQDEAATDFSGMLFQPGTAGILGKLCIPSMENAIPEGIWDEGWAGHGEEEESKANKRKIPKFSLECGMGMERTSRAL